MNKIKNPISSELRSLYYFTLSTLSTTAAQFAIRIAKNIVITRSLGPLHRGAFTLLSMIPSMLVGLGEFGQGMSNAVLLASKKYDMRKIMGNTLIITTVAGSILVSIAYLIFKYHLFFDVNNHLILTYVPVVLLAIPLTLLNHYMMNILVAIQSIHFANSLTLLSSGLLLILFLLFRIISHNALKDAMYAWLLSIVIVAAISSLNIFRRHCWPPRISIAYLKESLKFGSKDYIGNLCFTLETRVDVFLISYFTGMEAVGQYAVAASMIEILLTIPQAVFRPYFPLRMGLENQEAGSFAPIVIRHVLFVMALVCLAIFLTGKILIFLFFGKVFLVAYIPLCYKLPGLMSYSVYTLLKADLYSRHLPGYVSIISIISLLTNISLGLLLIPHFGIAGAGISFSVSNFLSTSLLLVKFIKISKCSYGDVLLIKRSDIKRLLEKILRKKQKSV